MDADTGAEPTLPQSVNDTVLQFFCPAPCKRFHYRDARVGAAEQFCE